MAKKHSKRFDYKVEGGKVISGEKPDQQNAFLIDDHVAPCEQWFDLLETRCVKGCCGLAAYGLSRREVTEAIPPLERLEASKGFKKLASALSAVDAHSVRSRFWCDTVERHTAIKVLSHLAEELKNAA